MKKYTAVFITLLVFVVGHLFSFLLDENQPNRYDVVIAIFINLILICSGIWLIITGVHTATGTNYYFGVFTLLMTALLRYFNLIDDYLSGAALFFVASAIMFLAARWWHKVIRNKRETESNG